jgi:hypothetical protein
VRIYGPGGAGDAEEDPDAIAAEHTEDAHAGAPGELMPRGAGLRAAYGEGARAFGSDRRSHSRLAARAVGAHG